MKIGEIAKAAGVSTSRIRFYEREGIIPPGERLANGYRDYPARLVGLLRFIEQAQGLGFTLREIARVEPQEGAHVISCEDALTLLAAKHAAVTALIADAEDRRRRIAALMAELKAGKAEAQPELSSALMA
ncbi:MerR family transcriptional regulator [Paracoccus lutimaris]|uniref:MerR family transcriptional regulator n=1 Tax=Paracoccus lutimaris TaxID=1490030 RepID=A0A368Z752_9RHOB|nr:MerR family transcriptional regulator [Paracoccus lutimaris]RCW88295.1 MerR family transcriptional regulator [Paracoccus lutimaris]